MLIKRWASHLAHRCEVKLPASRWGWHPLDGPARRGRLTNPWRADLLKILRHTTCLKCYNHKPDYWYILSRLLTCKALRLGSSFAEKLLILDPYFQYFSPNWVSSYKQGLPTYLEKTWLSIIKYHKHKSNFHLSVLSILTTMRLIDQGSHIRESRRLDQI